MMDEALPLAVHAIRALAAAVKALAIGAAETAGDEGLDEVDRRLADVAQLVGEEK